MVRSILRLALRILYRVEVNGLASYPGAGERAVIVANHPSRIDGLLLQAFLPGPLSLVVSPHLTEKWWWKAARSLVDLIAVDASTQGGQEKLAHLLAQGRRIILFPEARVSVSTSLMKVHDDAAAVAWLADAKVVPVHIDGAQYSFASNMRGRLRLRRFPKIILTVHAPVKFKEQGRGAADRSGLAQKLYDVMTEAEFRSRRIDQHLFAALLDARRIHGGHAVALEDITRSPIGYSRLVMASFVLGRRLAKLTRDEVNVGVLLPNVIGCIVAFFGLHAFGKVPAMLNYSTGAINMAAACAAARLATIVTSRRFIEQAQMGEALALLAQKARVVYLEDVRRDLHTLDKLYGVFAARLPGLALGLSRARLDPDAPAVILFTSGSEGMPKGVVLSHRNINANRHQVAARIAFDSADTAFNALPVFHALGLTGGTLLPLLGGVRTFLYPSPLHYKIVPKLCYEINATILFGTDTFLTGYARNAHPFDFHAVRYVVAGAERVREETHATWMERFGLRILEGYGTTECSPVISVNTPLQFKTGTAGRVLDAISWRLEPVEGIERGGRLIVRGPNVMLGYLRADAPGVLEPPPGGWYDTGDIVDIDGLGYITILGRAKRFAKVGGEMISLTAVETALGHAFPDHAHAVVAVADPRKGEQLVVITTKSELEAKSVRVALRQQGVHELMIPRQVIHVPELPVLGSGKTDYVSLARLARAEGIR
jgi:acyl-[acyl-carrier-protein]-phospholipid O-acyltransferase/long-chain-fatty-acid--[acyl-carrier-protein] ligase